MPGASVEFVTRSRQVLRALDRMQTTRMQMACIHLQNEIKRTLSGPRSGKKYRVPGTKRYYTASAPGEPPAVRTGRLRNSIKYKLVRGFMRAKGEVGSSLDYAAQLEFGTSKMAPRPYLRPTYEKERQTIKRILAGKVP